MTGIELLEMTLKTSAQGIIVAAEDEYNSWSAIKREGFDSILNRPNIKLTS